MWLLPGPVGDAGRCSAIAVPRWACRQPAVRNGNATAGNTGELALIPCMILSGLVLGRWGKVANVVALNTAAAVTVPTWLLRLIRHAQRAPSSC